MQGIVSDIQRFSLHDGPGIRSTVFLKGCNLRCAWCHNPETLRGKPELQWFPEKCIGCGACVRVCQVQAHGVEDGQRVFHRARCVACGACARECYAEALVLVGRAMTADEVLAEVGQDVAFYRESGGGVTLSGGEPLCQPAFTREVLERCRQAGIATALETNLAYPWETLAPLLPLLDLVMVDLKLLDPAAHRQWTGADNARTLANVRRLAQTTLPLIVRTPVIPGANDTAEAIDQIAELIAGFPGLLYYELLPYHPLGTGKYHSLSMEYTMNGVERPTVETMAALAAVARQRGIEVRVAGTKVVPHPQPLSQR